MFKQLTLIALYYSLLALGMVALGFYNLVFLTVMVILPIVSLGASRIYSAFSSPSKRFGGWGNQKYAKTLFKNTSNPMVIIDKEGNILRRNQASLDRLGRESRNNLNLAEVIHPDDLNDVKTEMERVFTTEAGYVRDVSLRLMLDKKIADEQSKTIPATMNATSVTDHSAVIEFIDHQEKDQLKQRLRESTARYRYLIEDAIDTLDSGVVLVDKNQEVVWINERMEEFFNLDREQLIGLNVERARQLIKSSFEQPEEFEQVTSAAYEQEQKVASHTCVIGGGFDSSERVLEYRSIPIQTDRYEGGRIEHFIDITEVKRLERGLREKTERLKNTNEKLEAFSRSISHDLKAPLQKIESFSQLLQGDYEDSLDKQGQQALGALIEMSQRLRDRISALLDYAKTSVEKESFKEVDLEQLLNEIISDLDFVMSGTQIHIEDDLPPIYGHRASIGELFSNLLTNAVKYNDEDQPVVEIGWEGNHGSQVKYWVRDNGQGIKDEYLEKIFQVFEKLNPRDNSEGTGIGLALCKRIVEEHGGNIWAKSEVGEGTTFYFTLPTSSDQTSMSSISQTSSSSERKVVQEL